MQADSQTAVDAIDIEDPPSQAWPHDLVWTVALAAFANATGAREQTEQPGEVCSYTYSIHLQYFNCSYACACTLT
jgi:hypothetical protein